MHLRANNNQKLKGLKNALYDFARLNLMEILDYRLSWIELTILNNICRTYATINLHMAFTVFIRKATGICTSAFVGCSRNSVRFPVTLGMLIRFLMKIVFQNHVALVPRFPIL